MLRSLQKPLVKKSADYLRSPLRPSELVDGTGQPLGIRPKSMSLANQHWIVWESELIGT